MRGDVKKLTTMMMRIMTITMLAVAMADPEHEINNNNIDTIDNETVVLGTPTQPTRAAVATRATRAATKTTTKTKINIAAVDDDTTICDAPNDTDNDNVAATTRTTTINNNGNEDEDANDLYEPADIEWCRRRPTWRNRKGAADDEEQEEEYVDDNSIYEKCSKVLDFSPDVDILTKGKHPYLASEWNDTYTFTNDDSFRDNTYLEKERRRHNQTYHTLPILERPLFQQLIQCMDQELLTIQKEEQVKANTSTCTMRNGTITCTGFDGTEEKNNEKGKMLRPQITKVYKRNSDQLSVASIVEHSLNDMEAHSFTALSTCLRQQVPEYQFLRREFSHGGGNDVTHTSGFLHLLLPGVASQVKRITHLVWQQSQWEEDNTSHNTSHVPVNREQKNVRHNPVPTTTSTTDTDTDADNDDGSPEEEEKDVESDVLETDNRMKVYSTKWRPNPHTDCGIRTAEYLSYDTWPDGLGYHDDTASDYTISIALSHPTDYEGGDFTLFPDKFVDDHGPSPEQQQHTFKAKRWSAVVFLSELMHGVEPIYTKGRKMFVSELWRYDDAPALITRPSRVSLVYGNPNSFFAFDKEGKEDGDYPYPSDKDNDVDDDDNEEEEEVVTGGEKGEENDECENSHTMYCKLKLMQQR